MSGSMVTRDDTSSSFVLVENGSSGSSWVLLSDGGSDVGRNEESFRRWTALRNAQELAKRNAMPPSSRDAAAHLPVQRDGGPSQGSDNWGSSVASSTVSRKSE